jgi:hypothetical protein
MGIIEQTSVHADNNYYVWQDEFENAQRIDTSYSNNYIINNGVVEMYGTYERWTDPAWSRMKEITIMSTDLVIDCILKFIIDYDSDMRSDYGDLRFKFESDDLWFPYWIEEVNPEPNNPYAIVWIRISSLSEGESNVYLFYGNPAAINIGSYWDVFDENSWNKYYLHDHRVTYHGEREGAWDPDVTWGDNKFFVTWEEGVPSFPLYGMLFKQQIRGCFYSEDGILLGNRFDITPWDSNPGVTFRCENPSTAYGSSGSIDHYFVAYESYTEPINDLSRNIRGAIVPSDTTSILDVSDFIICNANGNQADPCVAYDPDNNRFFVVWEDGRQGTSNYNVYGRLFDINGNPIGSEKIISSRPNSQCEPWITYDMVNHHYMIVWEEGLDAEYGPFDIWGQLFTVNGDPLGDAQRLSSQGSSNTDYNFPCVSFCELKERYLVTWQEDDISQNNWYGPIWGKILDENGNTIVETFQIAYGSYERTNIVPHLSSSFFVCFDGGGDIWGKLVSADGDIIPYTIQLSDGESDPADWANIGSSGEKIFVAWEDTRVVYIPPYENLNLPDIYTNVWSFNSPSGTDVSYDVGEEKSLVLESIITSIVINPINIESWVEFDAVKQGDVKFDVVDAENPENVILSDISPGSSLQSISLPLIRLRATFSRMNPSSSPLLDLWQVSYVGEDTQKPVTSVDNIDGIKGLNEWYISESIILWLHAEDFPTDTGSGIWKTYYLMNGQGPYEYNDESGLQLQVSQESQWKGSWVITFWSEDNAGNIEESTNSENTIELKIDADRPYIEITSPADEEQVNVPFWVRASPSDNVGIDYVEFDIEPFGERPDMPYIDTTPPYEWYCDVQQDTVSKQKTTDASFAMGVNRMVRARVYDESGQSWNHEVWVHIKNWKKTKIIALPKCLVIGFGASDKVFNNVQSLTSDGEHIPESIFFNQDEFTWEYSSGFCLFIHSEGIFSQIGHQEGTISEFVGVSSKNQNIFFGFGQTISVQAFSS